MQISRLATTPEGARQIALSGQSYSQTLRALAWRTLKAERGQTMNSARMLVLSMASSHHGGTVA